MPPTAKPERREYAPGQWTNLAEEVNEGGDGTVEPVINVYTKLKDQKQCSACALWGRRRFFAATSGARNPPMLEVRQGEARRQRRRAVLCAPDIVARNGGIRGRLSWGTEPAGEVGAANVRDVTSARGATQGARRAGGDDDDSSPEIKVPGLRPGAPASPSSRSPNANRTYDPNAPIPEAPRRSSTPGSGTGRPRSSPSAKPSPLYRSPASSGNLSEPPRIARTREARRDASPPTTVDFARAAINHAGDVSPRFFRPVFALGAIDVRPPIEAAGTDRSTRRRTQMSSHTTTMRVRIRRRARRATFEPDPEPRASGDFSSSGPARESSAFGVPRIFDRFGEKVRSPDGSGGPRRARRDASVRALRPTGKPTRFSEEEWHAPHAERRCLACAGKSRAGAPEYSPSGNRASESRARESRREPRRDGRTTKDASGTASVIDDFAPRGDGERGGEYDDERDDDDDETFRRAHPRRPSATSTTYSVRSRRAERASGGFAPVFSSPGPSSSPGPFAALARRGFMVRRVFGQPQTRVPRAHRRVSSSRGGRVAVPARDGRRYAPAAAGTGRDRSSAARDHLREFANRADDIGATPDWWTPFTPR